MDEINKDHNKEEEEAAAASPPPLLPCHADDAAANDNPNTNVANGNGNGNGKKKEEEEEEEEKERRRRAAAPVQVQQQPRRRRSSFQVEREYPPPIPLLARTGNLPCHMPWVLKRSYTDNGRRLVIQEVKVKHHEYFRAHRANGRLTLQMMQLDESSSSLLSFRPESRPPDDSDRNEDNSPSSSSSSESPSPPSSPSAAAENEYAHHVKINAVEVERSNQLPSIPTPMPSSSLPPSPSPSMLSKELKSIPLDVNRGRTLAPQDNHCTTIATTSGRSLDDDGDGKNTAPEVTEMGVLPSALSSSLPESSFGIGGGGSGSGGGCCVKRPISLFSTPIPTIRPVHS